MVSEVRDCMRMFPVPAKEPERMLVINEGDFLNIRPEDSAFEALQRLTKRASLKWGIMGLSWRPSLSIAQHGAPRPRRVNIEVELEVK